MEEQQKKESAGAPAWVMTFADLMSLLMCFFVLLLAFSEMDAAKFKQLAGSMKDAFGVQNEIEVRTIPKGTSVVAREFSPGKPEPTALNTIRQFTIDSNRNTLDLAERDIEDIDKAREKARMLREALKEEIDKGNVAIETEGRRVIVRIMEKASFAPGQIELRSDFVPILEEIGRVIAETSGLVSVSGHTDNQPVQGGRFRSNWDISSARAVSVAHGLFDTSPLRPSHVQVVGHADTRPVADNDTAEGRALNRRVEIQIIQGAVPEEEPEQDPAQQEVYSNAPI